MSQIQEGRDSVAVVQPPDEDVVEVGGNPPSGETEAVAALKWTVNGASVFFEVMPATTTIASVSTFAGSAFA